MTLTRTGPSRRCCTATPTTPRSTPPRRVGQRRSDGCRSTRGKAYTDTITVPSVALSYFAPDPPPTPPPSRQRRHLDPPGRVDRGRRPYWRRLPRPRRYRLRRGGIYYFPVPADTTATLKVADYQGAGWDIEATGTQQIISLYWQTGGGANEQCCARSVDTDG